MKVIAAACAIAFWCGLMALVLSKLGIDPGWAWFTGLAAAGILGFVDILASRLAKKAGPTYLQRIETQNLAVAKENLAASTIEGWTKEALRTEEKPS